MTDKPSDAIAAAMIQAATTLTAEKLRMKAQALVARNGSIREADIERLFIWDTVGEEIGYTLHAVEKGYATYLAHRDDETFPAIMKD